MKPEELKALQREIQIHKTLSHPNIVPLVAAFEDKGRLFIFLESLRTNLFEYMQPRTFDEETALRFFREVVKAVAYIHNRKLVHRDIKPENVLLDENRRVKLCDFGFSAPIEAGEKRDTFCGTQQYLPPEIVLGHEQTDKVDIWCLGVLLFELIHKRVPFVNKSMPAYLDSVTKKNLSFISKVSPGVRKLILSCLEMEPAKRPTAVQILNDPAVAESAFKGQQRASSVVGGERPNKLNPKALGIPNPVPLNGAGPQAKPQPQLVSKSPGVISSDKHGKDLAPLLAKEDWFADVAHKKRHVSPLPNVGNGPGIRTINVTPGMRPAPTGSLQAPPSPMGTPVKINFYKNTNFGPENFQKKSQMASAPKPTEFPSSPSPQAPASGVIFWNDGRTSAQQQKNSGSTAISGPQVSGYDQQGNAVRMFSPIRSPQSGTKETMGVMGELPSLQRRHTDRPDTFSPKPASPLPHQRMTMSPNHVQYQTGGVQQIVHSNPSSNRPISPVYVSAGPKSPQIIAVQMRSEPHNPLRPSDPGNRSVSPNSSPAFLQGYSNLPPIDPRLLVTAPSAPGSSPLGRGTNFNTQASRSPNRS